LPWNIYFHQLKAAGLVKYWIKAAGPNWQVNIIALCDHSNRIMEAKIFCNQGELDVIS